MIDRDRLEYARRSLIEASYGVAELTVELWRAQRRRERAVAEAEESQVDIMAVKRDLERAMERLSGAAERVVLEEGVPK